MKLSDFAYDLPPERIAQRPLPRRDESKLMVLDRKTGAVEHRRFDALTTLLQPGDLLVMNDTRVIPARLLGRKPTGGRVEILLVERVGEAGSAEEWLAMIRASRLPAIGGRVRFAGGLEAAILERDRELWRVRLEGSEATVADTIERVGRTPLPPYIRREDDEPEPAEDRQRYQTVYASRPGAIAAPTAGLHFTSELLGRLTVAGIRQARLTLHVGMATFVPVRTETIDEHRMPEEWLEVAEPLVEAVERTRARSGRVVAVGTTVVRALESCAAGRGRVRPLRGRCGLFIRPGYRFRVVDALITNFHLPCSTLLMLVSALAGREQVLAAYREAIRTGYRFYSYGDAMMVRPT